MFLLRFSCVLVVVYYLEAHRIQKIYDKVKTLNDYCSSKPPTQLLPLYNRMVHSFLSDEMRRNSHYLIMYLDRVREMMKRTSLDIERQDYVALNSENDYVKVQSPSEDNALISLRATGRRSHKITEHHYADTTRLIRTFYPRDDMFFQVQIIYGLEYVSYRGDEDKWLYYQLIPTQQMKPSIRYGNWTECDRSKLLIHGATIKKVCRVFDSHVISKHGSLDSEETQVYASNMINYTSGVIKDTVLEFFLPTLELYRTETNVLSKLETLQIDHFDEDPISMSNATKTLTWMLPPESRVTFHCMGESLEYFGLGHDRWLTSFSMTRNHTIRDVELPASIMTRSSHIVVVMEFEESLWMAPPNQTFSISPDCRATYYTHFEHTESHWKYCRDFPCTHNLLVL